MKYFLLLISSLCFAQQVKSVDFRTCRADISVDFESREVRGLCQYTFEVLSPIDTIKIDAANMKFTRVVINGKDVKSASTATSLNLFEGFKEGKNTVSFGFLAVPKQTMYFVGDKDNYQIWTQGQGKNTSHWLPSFNDVNEKVVFNLTITADDGYEVISNGRLQNEVFGGGKREWEFGMSNPMSSYLVMLAIGKFNKFTERSASAIPLEMYISKGDESKVEPTYRYSAKIFNFLEKEIGVNYPWEIYKQVPARDFLYGGMENTSATVFAQDYVVDDTGYNDKNYINVNAHELAHQWFGDMVTAKTGKHHWLQEGFATYYALLAEKDIFGDDYFNWKLYDMAEELQQAAKTDTVPLLNEKASSLTFYKKGAWALHVLRNGVGEELFRKAVKSYLEKYAFKNVDTDEFLAEISKVSNYDVVAFRKRWLESPGFEVKGAIDLLKKNESMKAYFHILDLQPKSFADKKREFTDILKSQAFTPLKQEVVYQMVKVPFEEKAGLIHLAMASNDVELRQSVARAIGDFPDSFYAEYETFLNDKSYITQEMALATLWKKFPDKHKELLDKMQYAVGFNEKNLRIQWLTLALTEKDYRPGEKVKYYDELIDYASPKYESSIRQNALENLIFIGPYDTNAMKLLVNPLVHHKWQFQKFAREKIRALIKFIAPRNFYAKLLPTLPENERTQLAKLLDEK